MEKTYSDFEVRELSEDDSLILVCKVNDYGLSKELRGINGSFREVVPKETWEKAIESHKDSIKVFYNHKDYFDIGIDKEFRVEDDGVYLYLSLNNNEKGLYNAAKNGDISGLSFEFKCLKDKWSNEDNFKKRTILDMELYEVSILDKTPAYNNTSVEVRSLYVAIDLDIKRKGLELSKFI